LKLGKILELSTYFNFQVPGAEGRAGMVAINQGKESPLDLEKLAEGLKSSLPNYARPIFIRILAELDLTGMLLFYRFFTTPIIVENSLESSI
jgi:hypothetical protein